MLKSATVRYNAEDFDVVICCGSKDMFDGIAAWKARGLVEAWWLESPEGIADGPGGTIAYQRLRDQIKSKCHDLLWKIDNPRGGLLAGCFTICM